MGLGGCGLVLFFQYVVNNECKVYSPNGTYYNWKTRTIYPKHIENDHKGNMVDFLVPGLSRKKSILPTWWQDAASRLDILGNIVVTPAPNDLFLIRKISFVRSVL